MLVNRRILSGPMTAAVLSIGTELVRGELVNSNAAWLGERLSEMGFEVVEHATVDDDPKRIVEAIRRLARAARVVVSTGGLGPTSDDLTTRGAADALGVELVRDEGSLAQIRDKYRAFGREMPESNEKQADFPEGARVIPNGVGTAPGFAVELGESHLFFLPGVPREMKRLFLDTVARDVSPMADRTSHQEHIRTFGLTESRIAEALADIEGEHEGVTLGYRASFPEIEVKVLARSNGAADAEVKSRKVAAVVRERLGDAVYGGRDDTFPGAVGDALRRNNLSLSLAESCTGGMVGSMVTSVPGSSDYLLFDAVTYANSAKEQVLKVNPEVLRAHGAVSAEVAAEMAEGALRIADSDLAIAITGIAGPGGGTDEKPVGTVWLGLAQRGKPTATIHRVLPGDRQQIQTLASYLALRLVLRAATGVALDSD